MGNEQTKAQLRRWIEGAIKEAKSPDIKKQLRKKRELKKKEILRNYGLR